VTGAVWINVCASNHTVVGSAYLVFAIITKANPTTRSGNSMLFLLFFVFVAGTGERQLQHDGYNFTRAITGKHKLVPPFRGVFSIGSV
jgi:hypothetical protein